jgi:hypothetical protein
MGATPIMSMADNRQLLSLAYARTALTSAPAASGAIGLSLEAKQLDQARAQMRDGETFSVTA